MIIKKICFYNVSFTAQEPLFLSPSRNLNGIVSHGGDDGIQQIDEVYVCNLKFYINLSSYISGNRIHKSKKEIEIRKVYI